MKKILFVDRDGTLIKEPADQQIDSLDKLSFVSDVMIALRSLVSHGYRLVMVTNQDGLGSADYPQEAFDVVQGKLVDIFSSQGIVFDDVLICPHYDHDNCQCRKPRLAMVTSYLKDPTIDWQHSYVIGDRESDAQLATHMQVSSFLLPGSHDLPSYGWREIEQLILHKPRRAKAEQKTRETQVAIEVRLDEPGEVKVSTGLGFFDHMLEQIGCHGKMGLTIEVKGDLDVDHHHTIEDTAILLGEVLRQSLSDKIGIERYGASLPMDEAAAQVTMDLSGRAYLVYEAEDLVSKHAQVGGIPVPMFEHFFRSLSTALGCNLHMKVTGDDGHHMVEGLFKAFSRCFAQAAQRTNRATLPSTKGSL